MTFALGGKEAHDTQVLKMQVFYTPLNIRGASQQNGRRWGLVRKLT